MRIKTLWQSTTHASPFGSRILLTAGTNGLSAEAHQSNKNLLIHSAVVWQCSLRL
jgi:hypothetical protein